ncbi:PPE family protein [Mycobacterium sp. 050272]|uniref:PPE family protein n=1 Tax=Mycobacterium sp. 050272 TaxID=3142488 RepID=UPI00318561E8
MDFAVLPPEVNSGRMYSGPGPATLLAASSEWAELAVEMHLAAAGCEAVAVALLNESWSGPSSAAMAAAVLPYAGWVRAVATQCEEVASQATVAASAYETAYAMTVPPTVIAANRLRFSALIAGNLMGQNTPAIMVAEAEYSEMWARDTAAMYGYAANSASALRLSAFPPPPQPGEPGGDRGGSTPTLGEGAPLASSGISAAFAMLSRTAKTSTQGVSTSTGTGMQAASQLATTMVRLADVGGSSAPEIGTSALGFGSDGFGLSTDISGFALDLAGSGLELVGGDSLLGAEEAIPAEIGTLESIDPLAGPFRAGLSGEPSAGLGQAAQLGTLSVPPSWATALSADAENAGSHAVAPAAHHGSSHGSAHRHAGMVYRDAGTHRVGVRSALVPRSPIGG